MSRSAGRLLVDQLLAHGTEVVFCVPGESFLPVLDALHEGPPRLVSCRHEAAAATMAEAWGKLSGRPGVCIVTRGPGACHAAVGVHTAFQDSTPLLMLVGQVASDHQDREAFQEIDFRRMFGELTKWVAQVDRAERLPEYLARAFATACSGRPGPVVLALPEDMLDAESDAADALPFHASQPDPGVAQLERLGALLGDAERPLALLGGAGWSAAAAQSMRTFLEANRLPAAAAFRRQDALDNDSDCYVGDVGIAVNPALAARVREADLLLVVGPRLGEVTTSGYTLLEPPSPQQRLVHVHPGAEELGRVYTPELAILSGMGQFAAALGGIRATARWERWRASARADYLEWQRGGTMPGALDLRICIEQLRERLPDAIVSNGAGNFSVWVHRFWRYHSFPSQLAPTSGAMGYGVPAAVAAKLAQPSRPVVCFAGDGDFLMSGQELATAVQYDAAVLVLVVNNGMYGTIRMHQERRFPGRVSGSELRNPDFAAYARAFGAHGETVLETGAFAPALERALDSGLPALLELRIDPEAITPVSTLAEIRAAARAAAPLTA